MFPKKEKIGFLSCKSRGHRSCQGCSCILKQSRGLPFPKCRQNSCRLSFCRLLIEAFCRLSYCIHNKRPTCKLADTSIGCYVFFRIPNCRMSNFWPSLFRIKTFYQKFENSNVWQVKFLSRHNSEFSFVQNDKVLNYIMLNNFKLWILVLTFVTD
jgi:hypothetical protein